MEPVLLRHHGVKGMKWGVRKDKKPGRIGEEIKSIKRERSWKKELKDLDSKSPAELNKLSNRIQLENDMKRLSKNKDIANKQDKSDYRNREKLSDKELLEKVNKLRAKDNLNRNVNEASRTQMELGKKLVQVAAVVGFNYAMSGKLSTKDLGMAAINPMGAYNGMKDRNTKRLFEETNKDLFVRSK